MTLGPVSHVRAQKIEVTALKVDKKLGLVFGYAIVCKVKNADGDFEPYYDSGTEDPDDGEIYSDHITEKCMLEAVTDFMKSSRVATEMHEREVDDAGERIMDAPVQKGTVVHSFPLTEDIAAALGISCEKTGWLVAMQPDASMLKKFESGALKQFSIGGLVARQKERAK